MQASAPLVVLCQLVGAKSQATQLFWLSYKHRLRMPTQAKQETDEAVKKGNNAMLHERMTKEEGLVAKARSLEVALAAQERAAADAARGRDADAAAAAAAAERREAAWAAERRALQATHEQVWAII